MLHEDRGGVPRLVTVAAPRSRLRDLLERLVASCESTKSLVGLAHRHVRPAGLVTEVCEETEVAEEAVRRCGGWPLSEWNGGSHIAERMRPAGTSAAFRRGLRVSHAVSPADSGARSGCAPLR